MRLAVIESAPKGGLLHYAAQLSEALAARGHEVDLITAKGHELDRTPVGTRVRGVLPPPVPEPRRGAHRTPLPASSSRGRDTGRGCLGSHGVRGRSWGLRHRPAGRRPERRAAGRRGPGPDRDPGRPARRGGLSRAPPANPARRQPLYGVGAAFEAAADPLPAFRHRVRTWPNAAARFLWAFGRRAAWR